MDVLYYSKHCKHSQKVIQYVMKSELTNKLSCICIDKRQRDHNNNNIIVTLENGNKIILPPNIQNVPALLRVNQNYTVLFGDEQIIQYLNEKFMNGRGGRTSNTGSIHGNSGEPNGYIFGSNQNSIIMSEKFTDYNLTPEDLNAKGVSKSRNLMNYVPASHEIKSIHAPPETYKPDKISSDLTIEVIQKKRNMEIPATTAPTPHLQPTQPTHTTTTQTNTYTTTMKSTI